MRTSMKSRRSCMPASRNESVPRRSPMQDRRKRRSAELCRFERAQLGEVAAYLLAPAAVQGEVDELAGVLLQVVQLVVLVVEVGVHVVQLRRRPGRVLARQPAPDAVVTGVLPAAVEVGPQRV